MGWVGGLYGCKQKLHAFVEQITLGIQLSTTSFTQWEKKRKKIHRQLLAKVEEVSSRTDRDN